MFESWKESMRQIKVRPIANKKEGAAAAAPFFV